MILENKERIRRRDCVVLRTISSNFCGPGFPPSSSTWKQGKSNISGLRMKWELTSCTENWQSSNIFSPITKKELKIREIVNTGVIPSFDSHTYYFVHPWFENLSVSSKQNTHVFPSGVSAFKRNSYDAKYIPEAGTSVEKPSKHEKIFHILQTIISIADQII